MSTIAILACFLRTARRQNVFVTTNHHKLRHRLIDVRRIGIEQHPSIRSSSILTPYTLYAFKIYQIIVCVRTNNSRKNVFGFGTNEWMLQCKDGAHAYDSMAAMLYSNFVFSPFCRFGSGTRTRPE